MPSAASLMNMKQPSKMPVLMGDWTTEEEMREFIDDTSHSYFQLETSLAVGVPVEFYTSTPLPSDDIWKKFDLPDIPMSEWSASAATGVDEHEFDTSFDKCANASVTSLWTNMDPAAPRSAKESREIMHHDCMWAGHCVNKEHINRTLMQIQHTRSTSYVKNSSCLKHEPEVTTRVSPFKNVRAAGGIKQTVSCSSQNSLSNTKNDASLVKSINSRSLLLSSRTNMMNSNSSNSKHKKVVVNNVRPIWENSLSNSSQSDRFHRQSLESDGDSPRPETPQSLSESEEEIDDHPRFKHSLDNVFRSSVASCDSVASFLPDVIEDKVKDISDYIRSGLESSDLDDDDCADSSLAVSVSEVTGQVCRSTVMVKQEPVDVYTKSPKREAYYSDHSYHLSKGSVKMDSLGVQTPSDSEEEIDVVSVGDKLPGRSGSGMGGTTLPTNPSARDRQQLQLTVASAITAASKHPKSAEILGMPEGGKTTIPLRITIGDRTVSVRTVPTDMIMDYSDKKRKNISSRGPAKGVKRAKYQYHHRLQHHKSSNGGRGPRRGSSRMGNSDSEPDSCEKRSLHNNMERQRRIDLRNLVEGLRVLVPEVDTKKRAAKVVILKEASVYCSKLRDDGKYLVSHVAELRREQERLRARVSQLRRQAAAQR